MPFPDHSTFQDRDFRFLQDRAALFDGALEALTQLAGSGWEIVIVSHKTKTPFLGPPYDLHAAAHGFLHASELLKPRGPVSKAWFETTKEEKIQRIALERCDAFLDDLPEILLMPEFPTPTRKLLFAPNQEAKTLCSATSPAIAQVHSWTELPAVLRGPHGQ